jgi:hypothetical protein
MSEPLQPVSGRRNQLRTFHVRNMNVNSSTMSLSDIIKVTEKLREAGSIVFHGRARLNNT